MDEKTWRWELHIGAPMRPIRLLLSQMTEESCKSSTEMLDVKETTVDPCSLLATADD